MKKITIIKTPKQEVLTKDEIDLLFEEYEKIYPLSTVHGLKEIYLQKDIKPHERLIKEDSNVDYILIRKISEYIPPLIVDESDVSSLKLEKIQYVEVISKSRIKCYNYKTNTFYYSYTGEKLFIMGFYVPTFSELSRTIEIPFTPKSPKLAVREFLNTSNGDAEIQQGETVYFDLVVENQGDLDAEGVEAILDFTHSGIDFQERSKTIGRVPAGGKSNTIRFSFLVKTGATVGPLSGELTVRQADGFPEVKKRLDYLILLC